MVLNYKKAAVFYTDTATSNGTTIVLLHGFLENASMWNEISSELSKRNRIVTIDLLGHGRSDCLGYLHSMELFSETVEAVLKQLRIRKCIVIGHSLGGYVALAFAERNPQKIKGLCLLNATSNEDDQERKQLRTRANMMIQNNFTTMVRMSFTNLFSEVSRVNYADEIKNGLDEALKTSIQGYIAGQEGMKLRPNRNHVLAKNDFKKMIITGRKDPVLEIQKSIEEAEKTNSKLIIFPDGHMSHIENFAKLIVVLKNFTKDC
ncbi:MAG: alpha/beta hydrolase [Polaribacter sp.]|jgi:pimeloyl-ACP methyl ester carboxylesterase|nr:alpha/beta hydrolase [Polaribacter sp.]